MGTFDSLVAGSFKLGEEGEWLFYPWGVAGRGYVLPGEAAFLRLRRRLGAGLFAVVALGLGAVWLAGPVLGLGLGAFGIVLYAVAVARATRGLEPSAERLRAGEAWAAQAEVSSAAEIGLFLAGSLSLAGFAAVSWARHGEAGALLATLGFAAAAAWFGRRLFGRGRAPS